VPQVGNEGMIRIRGLTSPILPTSASTIANDLFLGHLKSDSNIAYRSSTDTSSTSTFSGSNLESSEIHAGSSPSSLNSLSSSGSSSIGREGGHSALVISGQNAGGKTVALKDLGAAVFMARLGIPLQVCMHLTTLPLYASFFFFLVHALPSISTQIHSILAPARTKYVLIF